VIDVEIYFSIGFLSLGEISPNLTNYEREREKREILGALAL
jgi:hypothetical protein